MVGVINSTLNRYKFGSHASATSISSSVQPTVVISGKLSDRWALSQPIILNNEESDGLYIVYFDKLQVYGAGDNYTEAIAEIKEMLVSQIEDLLSSETDLAAGLQHLLSVYRTYVIQV